MSDPACEDVVMKTVIDKNSQAQLQLVLPAQMTRHRRASGRPCSQARARWWFDQIRHAIEESSNDTSMVQGRPWTA